MKSILYVKIWLNSRLIIKSFVGNMGLSHKQDYGENSTSKLKTIDKRHGYGDKDHD